jgi:hypothetical protein
MLTARPSSTSSRRDRSVARRGYGLPLVGVAVTLALIVVGILAIGRPIL